MSIFKITKAMYDRPSIKNTANYLLGKKDFEGYDAGCLGVYTGNMASNPLDANALADEIMLHHKLCGLTGNVRAVHAFIDFNGQVSSKTACVIARACGQFWTQKYVAWVYGLHLYKGDPPYLWPHVHFLISSRIMAGSYAGMVLQFDKELILEFDYFINKILEKNGAERINIIM